MNTLGNNNKHRHLVRESNKALRIPFLSLLVVMALALAACSPNVSATGTTVPTIHSNLPTIESSPTVEMTATAAAVPTIAAATPTTGSSPTVKMTAVPTTVPTPTAPAVIKSTKNSTLGTILVDSKGMTLYYFLKGTPDASNCSGNCAALWLPFLTNGTPATTDTAVTGALGVFTRTDGSQQVTYAGSPLYYYSGDKAAGDTNGQGVNSLWYAAPAAGIPTPMATSASTTESTSAPSKTPTP